MHGTAHGDTTYHRAVSHEPPRRCTMLDHERAAVGHLPVPTTAAPPPAALTGATVRRSFITQGVGHLCIDSGSAPSAGGAVAGWDGNTLSTPSSWAARRRGRADARTTTAAAGCGRTPRWPPPPSRGTGGGAPAVPALWRLARAGAEGAEGSANVGGSGEEGGGCGCRGG